MEIRREKYLNCFHSFQNVKVVTVQIVLLLYTVLQADLTFSEEHAASTLRAQVG